MVNFDEPPFLGTAGSVYELSMGFYRDTGTSTYSRTSLNHDGTGNPLFGKRFYAPRTVKVSGLIIPFTTAVATNAWDFNCAIFKEATSGSDSLPSTILDVNAQGVKSVAVNASNTHNQLLTFPADVVIPGGAEYFIMFLTKTGVSSGTPAAGAVAIRNTTRYLGNLDYAGGFTRFDIKSTTNVAYIATDMTNILSGLSWTDGLSGLQNLEFSFKYSNS